MVVDRWQNDDKIDDIAGELAVILGQVYFSVLRVEPAYNRVLILQSKDRPDSVGTYMNWTAYLNIYASCLTESGQRIIRERLSCRRLAASAQNGEKRFSFDVSYIRGGHTNWMTVSVLFQWSGPHICAYIMTEQTNQEHLFKSIIDLYVYNTFDYFIYLDAKNNSYQIFNRTALGAPFLPAHCEDYAASVVNFVQGQVIAEDREMTFREMQLPHVIEQLERHGVHSFYCGVQDPYRGYTRKQLTYRYYDRETQMILMSRTDVTGVYLEERARQNELRKAQRQAQTDQLTGLLNYRGALNQITDALGCDGCSAALLFIDLDNFKSINDTLGHLEGDRFLRQVAQVLRRQTRENDVQCRVGGDEFVVLLREIADREQAGRCAGRICEAIGRMAPAQNGAPSVSCSIGVAVAPEDGSDYATLVRKADRLAYQAKARGKNQYLI